MLSLSHIILLYCLYQPTLATNTFLLVLSSKSVWLAQLVEALAAPTHMFAHV